MTDLIEGSVETTKEIGNDDAAVVRRWLLELKLAGKEEKKWRENVDKLWDKYRAKDQAKNSFNIFWSNTEVMRQAVYSALPKPDVRRRFKDADPLGKAVSETLVRALDFSISCYDFDQNTKLDVLDNLITGRGISRVRYIPSLVQVGDVNETGLEKNETETTHESMEGEEAEELAWEQTLCEHVNWADFRHGPGKTWTEVSWTAFRHELRRDELEKRFGEKGKKLPLTASRDDDLEAAQRVDEETASLFKTAEVWEIWDKDAKKVLFIAEGSPKEPLQTLDDPLSLDGFFCVPRPIYALEDSETLIPTPLYNLYREQAEELNRISGRINKIVEALKVRGIYDSTLGELSELFKGADNDLIPASGVTALVERGGLDKFIWFAPIEQMAEVLRELYLQRDQCKQTIYELTGISDVIRGSTDPNETATAQGLKSKWGSLRLQRMQSDVQRYIRDLMCLMGEIIAGKFQQETLQQMTMLPYPTEAQWNQQLMQAQAQQQQAMQQYQMQAMQAQQTGRPSPPPPQQPPMPQKPITWEMVMEVLRSDAQRSYKVDIETDSTIAVELQQDMQGLQEVLSGLGETMQGLMPAVQQGFLPFEAAKEILLTICRRAKMGNSVEDAIDKMQQPPPPPDPEKGKAEAQMQVEQGKAQVQMQIKQMEADLNDKQHQRELMAEQQHAEAMAQIELQKEEMIQELQHRQIEAQNQIEAQRMQLEQQNEAALEQIRIASEERMAAAENQVKVMIAAMNNAAKLDVAEIAADTTLSTAQISAANKAEETSE